MSFILKSLLPVFRFERHGRIIPILDQFIRPTTHKFQGFRCASTDLGRDFEEAQKRLKTLKEDPGYQAKLKLYALYKQSMDGKCNKRKPMMVDVVGTKKWDAWNSLGDMGSEEAKRKYVELVNELVGAKADVSMQPTSSPGQFETILYTKNNGIGTIVLNRPNKKNALNMKAYEEIGQVLSEAASDKTVKAVAITGTGDYYCSGNDLSNFISMSTGDTDADAKKAAAILEKYVNSYIDFPKPLIGLINGPAIGISVTVLALFDLVYASDTATFHTPFSELGQSPEGCSSYTFPMLMGAAKANEVLMMGRKLTAVEAFDRGLVTAVFPSHSFKKEVESKLNFMGEKLPLQSLLYAKQVFRNSQKEFLHKINHEECQNLVERWQSTDCMEAIAAFMSKKSKL